jgi:hypothetical protein
MDLRKKLISGGAAATLLASLFAVSLAAPAFAATASPSTTTVPANGTATTVALATITATTASDIPVGSLTITLPGGYTWAATGTITATATGGTFAVSGGAITLGGTTATFTVTVGAAAGNTLAFSPPTVKTTTAGAAGDVVVSGLANPSTVVVARLRTPGQGDNNKGTDRGKSHGARKGAFFLNPTYTCATGAQPAANAKTFGFAILNTIGHHMLNVNVVLKGAKPNASYDVWVNQDPGSCPLAAPSKVGAVHTNARGNGTGHLRIAIVTTASHFWVSAVSGTDVLRTRAATLAIKH